MPFTPSANYTTYSALLNKKAVWVVDIDTVSDKYTSGTFSGITGSYKKYLKDVEIDSASVNLRNNAQNPTRGSFTLVDVNLEVTALIQSTNLTGLKVTIKHGFEDLEIADFLTVHPQLYINDIIVSIESAECKFMLSDPMFDFRQELFRNVPSTFLNGDITSGDTTVTVFDTTPFLATSFTGFGAGAAANTYIIIDDEVMLYTATTATTFTVTRAQCRTKAVAHTDLSPVKQCYVWGAQAEGGIAQISEVILNLLMTTSAGTNGECDAGIADFGLGIAKDKVDIDGIRIKAAEQYSQVCPRSIRYASNSAVANLGGFFLFFEKEAASNVLNDLASMINCAFSIDTSGKLTLVRADYFSLKTASNNLTAKHQWASNMRLNDAGIYNEILLSGSLPAYDATYYEDLNSFDMLTRFDTSQTEFGGRLQRRVRWRTNFIPGLYYAVYTGAGGNFTKGYVAEWLALFGDIVVDLNFDSLFTNMKYLAGDVVGYNDSNAPDLTAGTRGLTNEPLFITAKSMDMSNLEFDAQGFALLNRLSSYSAFGAYQTPTREAATLSATDSWTLEAADAYIDSPTGTYNYWKIKIELVSPASGSAKRSWVELSFKFMADSATETSTGNWQFNLIPFFYDPSLTYTWTYELIFWLPVDPAGALQRIKMDWVAASETSGSGLRPTTVKMKGVKGTNFTAADFSDSGNAS